MPTWIDSPGDLLTVLLIIGSFAGGTRIIMHSLDKRIASISKQMDERTKPIQTGTNGDSINARVNLIIERQGEIAEDLRAIRKDVAVVHGRVTEHIEWHLDNA